MLGRLRATRGPATDDELVARARNGDAQAFAEIVGRYQTSVYGYAVRILRDGDLADDATQEALISAHNAIDSFTGGNLRSWLFRIVHNKALDLLRARARRPAASLDANDAPEPADTTTSTPDAWADRAGMHAVIEEALGTLPEEQRAAVILRDVEGLAYDDIAHVLTIDLGTVKSRIARGRRRLQTLLLAHRELLTVDARSSSEGGPA